MTEEKKPARKPRARKAPVKKTVEVQEEVAVMEAPEEKAFALPPLGTYVEVKPLPLKKWHGKSGREDVSAPKAFEVLYDPRTGGYATGLTKEEQEYLENRMGVDLSDLFRADEPHPYWSSRAGVIKLGRETKIFDIGKPRDYLMVKNLKASVLIANSLTAWHNGEYPEATHYIHDEYEQVSISASKIQKKNEARKFSFKMPLEERINIVRILSNKSVKDRSPNFIDVEIDKIIEEDAAQFMHYAQMDKVEVNIRAKILECYDRNILIKNGPAYYYMGDKLGVDMEDTVRYFSDPQNQLTKVAIFEKLQAL